MATDDIWKKIIFSNEKKNHLNNERINFYNGYCCTFLFYKKYFYKQHSTSVFKAFAGAKVSKEHNVFDFLIYI